jgi:Asp-tRNA(Asn)/Glu-tRNA(Gln) amidotransferase B subunit
MPVLNADVLKHASVLGHALDAHVNQHISFDRKHYEYPDSPANFQRTQYHHPVITQ